MRVAILLGGGVDEDLQVDEERHVVEYLELVSVDEEFQILVNHISLLILMRPFFI